MPKRRVSLERIAENPNSFFSGCRNKKRYPSKRSAMGVVRVKNEFGEQAYKCSFCKSWHTGHGQ